MVLCLHVCVYMRVPDPQGLELQLAAMWVLGAEPRGYGRAASLLTHEPSVCYIPVMHAFMYL